MKTSALLLAASLVLTASLANAADKPSTPTADNAGKKAAKPAAAQPTKVAPKPKKAELTGSYIKREVHRNGMITDGADPVWVIDNKTIRNSGAADLRQLLIRQGMYR